MLYMDECNTESHTWLTGLRDDLPGVKGGAWVVLAPSDMKLSGATAYKINNFEGLTLYSYSLERWRNIFQVLDSEAHHNPVVLPEGIMREKGEGIKAEKQPIPVIYIAPRDLSINK